MNAAGRCVCPEGTTFRNGQCSPVGTGTPARAAEGEAVHASARPDPDRRRTLHLPARHGTEERRVRQGRAAECKLLPGQIRPENGRCVCPRGTSLVRGECRKDQPPQCKLLPGQIRLENGRCVCPRGTSLIRGECRKDQPPQCKLLPGQIRLETAAASARVAQASSGASAARAGGMPEGRAGRTVRDHRAALPARNGRHAAELPEASDQADQPRPAAASAAAPAKQQQHQGTVSLLMNKKTPPVRRRGF